VKHFDISFLLVNRRTGLCGIRNGNRNRKSTVGTIMKGTKRLIKYETKEKESIEV
jgi:hypothetical protein